MLGWLGLTNTRSSKQYPSYAISTQRRDRLGESTESLYFGIGSWLVYCWAGMIACCTGPSSEFLSKSDVHPFLCFFWLLDGRAGSRS